MPAAAQPADEFDPAAGPIAKESERRLERLGSFGSPVQPDEQAGRSLLPDRQPQLGDGFRRHDADLLVVDENGPRPWRTRARIEARDTTYGPGFVTPVGIQSAPSSCNIAISGRTFE